ncbi:DUF3037 domain-containing protein [Bradyrhizobium sp. 930_D9_N1_4]|uniref:DUF3037 domain-containing protein n=1 Tax=Bradyrhizobium sp. 930_D9_N1_4 TaxID=3240374 RepID=UPI003F8A3262
MAHSYSFAIIRLGTTDARDERLNVGVVVFDRQGLDVRVGRRVEKVRALSAGVEVDTLRELVANLSAMDERLHGGGDVDVNDRHADLKALGPLSLSPLGTFVAEHASEYEDRVKSILSAMVDVEPAPRIVREKRSKLLTQVKRVFKEQRVMAKRDEDLSSHRILTAFELDDGLVADLVLKNGAMHVVETVDATSEEETVRRAIAEVAVSAIVLERARMRFGKDNTKARLVYSASANLEKAARPSLEAVQNQGAELINWESSDDRGKFIHSMAMLATPIPTKRKRKIVGVTGPAFGF